MNTELVGCDKRGECGSSRWSRARIMYIKINGRILTRNNSEASYVALLLHRSDIQICII